MAMLVARHARRLRLRVYLESAPMPEVTVRDAVPADLPFLADMLYEAAVAAPPLRGRSAADVLAQPGIARYLAGWGRAGDTALIAEEAGVPRGAAWYRLYRPGDRGAGIVAERGVPELSIAVVPRHRGRGIGGVLLDALIARARCDGYPRLRLAVDPENPAAWLYRRHGFVDAGLEAPADGTALFMIAELD
jgi:ribosomal protein S18 acetylase RimI-like enzyme